MTSSNPDNVFAGSIPELYDTYLVPLIFEPYAADLVNRLRTRPLSRLLEIAAGTGVVTRALASTLPESCMITATDLNQAMLDQAIAMGTSRPIEWRQADAMQLPFEDDTFDAVLCQFGVMFFPDKPKAYSEVLRVLRSGGVFIFNAWDRIEENEFADSVSSALATIFPEDPPRFLVRTPYGYHDRNKIAQDLSNGGFRASPVFDTVTARSPAMSARDAAFAYCQGTPLRAEIESRDAQGLNKATEAAEKAIVGRFGPGAIEGKIQALVVTVEK